MSETRSSFPPVFWVANLIEVMERFAYYGIYFGFGIYMKSLGFSPDQLGWVQFIFLLLSYTIPVISGTFADRFGFKKTLLVAYMAYLPAILLLIFNKTFSGIALTMLTIGFAAGIFKPLIAGTVRAVTDKSNKTLGFGIFYAMVNVGGSFGPIVAGKLRAISWDHAFYAAAGMIVLMFLVTVFFYKEPPRQIEGLTLKQKFRDLRIALSDAKFTSFLVVLGVMWWVPFWAFFNLCALYVDSNVDTAQLYLDIRSVLGSGIAGFLSHVDEDGTRRVLGESISNTGYIIVILQVFVSKTIEKWRALPTFMSGLALSAAGFVILGYARMSVASMIFVGIFFFALGEMMASPRIQEYITWIAPKEKAGLYMGANFLATAIGAFSGPIYTGLYGRFDAAGHPEYVWYTLAAHVLLAIVVINLFVKIFGAFEEREA
ncbi:MAG: MFS transporter [Acidobacteria bacterium]|jgi:dipeptide/tripeptide permease|nr:MFS transporter [Acidobacteriota bacterium]